MCIRDSLETADIVLMADNLRNIPYVIRLSRATRRTLIVNPVSYTHLRAHETVLDLVCRLLLEKKKIMMTNTHTSITTYNSRNTQTKYNMRSMTQLSQAHL